MLFVDIYVTTKYLISVITGVITLSHRYHKRIFSVVFSLSQLEKIVITVGRWLFVPNCGKDVKRLNKMVRTLSRVIVVLNYLTCCSCRIVLPCVLGRGRSKHTCRK